MEFSHEIFKVTLDLKVLWNNAVKFSAGMYLQRVEAYSKVIFAEEILGELIFAI